MTPTLNFNLICRTCMAERSEMTKIFNMNSNSQKLSTMLTSFSSIQISEGDGLPCQICFACENKTRRVFNFKKQCERSDTMLRKYAAEHQTSDFPSSIAETTEEINKDLLQDSLDPLSWFPEMLLHNLSEDMLHKLIDNIKDKWREYKDNVTMSEDDDDDYKDADFVLDDIKVEVSDASVEATPARTKRKYTKRAKPDETNSEKKSNKGRGRNREAIDPHLRRKRVRKRMLCSLCGKSFANCTVLKKHQLIHTGEFPFECETCGKRFRQVENLRAHVSIHTGERAYLCPECGQNFRTKSGLCIHQQIHANVKKFECKVCGMKMNAHLARHMMTHSNEKPHICEICMKAFKLKKTLVAHLRTHTGERPYACNVCGQHFSQSATRNTHMKTHSVLEINTANETLVASAELAADDWKEPGAYPKVWTVIHKKVDHDALMAPETETKFSDIPIHSVQ